MATSGFLNPPKRCRQEQLLTSVSFLLQTLKDKVDKARLDSLQENEETMSELRNVYEREKILLLDENKKLQMDLERAVEMNGRLQLERRQTEEEYAELRAKKEAVAHWEAQISEIINWVSDEKDARGYLQVQWTPVNTAASGQAKSGRNNRRPVLTGVFI